MKIVAIVGTRTRNYDDLMRIGHYFMDCFNRLDKNDVIISGGCGSGADYWAKKKCAELKRGYIEAPAFWDRGKGAGLFRNTTIAEICTHMVAFWDGKSPGTLNAIQEAMKLNKPVWIVYV